MAKREAIRNEGQKAEDHFIQLIEGARCSDSPKDGDAVVVVDNRREHIEIKECHAAPGKSATINQVRAIKYICCVIWAPNRDCWYVISPDQLVHIAANKDRGQHTEIPFECMNFTLKHLDDNQDLCTKCKDSDLTQTVIAAIRRGRDNKSLSCLMDSLRVDIQSLREEYRKQVRLGMEENFGR